MDHVLVVEWLTGTKRFGTGPVARLSLRPGLQWLQHNQCTSTKRVIMEMIPTETNHTVNEQGPFCLTIMSFSSTPPDFIDNNAPKPSLLVFLLYRHHQLSFLKINVNSWSQMLEYRGSTGCFPPAASLMAEPPDDFTSHSVTSGFISTKPHLKPAERCQ